MGVASLLANVGTMTATLYLEGKLEHREDTKAKLTRRHYSITINFNMENHEMCIVMLELARA